MEDSVISSTTTVVSPARKRQVKNQDNANVPAGYKRCSHCGELKPLSEFNKDKSKKDGYNAWCRCCTREAQKKWDATRREKKQTIKSEQNDTPRLPFNYQRKVKRMQALSFAPETKECSCCHKVKPMTEFSCNKSHIDGFENKCKHCMSNYRKQKREEKKQEAEAMKQTQKTHQNNVQTFEYLPIGTILYYIKNEKVWATPIKGVVIDVAQNGTLISYKIEDEPSASAKTIYQMEIGSTVFCNELDLMNYIIKKAGIKMDGEVMNKLAFKVTAETIGHYQ